MGVDLLPLSSRSCLLHHHQLHQYPCPKTPSSTSEKVSEPNTESVAADSTPKSKTCLKTSSSPGPRTAKKSSKTSEPDSTSITTPVSWPSKSTTSVLKTLAATKLPLSLLWACSILESTTTSLVTYSRLLCERLWI